MSKTNSFAQNLAELTKNSKDILAMAESINEAMAGYDVSSNIDASTIMPSFTNVVNRLNRAENTIAKFTQGKGIVETDDGTYRKIKVDTISKPPKNVVYTNDISEFDINSNWFFEELQYPRCVVKLDLKGQIDDESDRVYTNRIIIDSTQIIISLNISGLDFYNSYIKDKDYTYVNLIALLEQYGVAYAEDVQEVKLPLTYEKYKGTFKVTDIKLIKNEKGVSKQWIYLDTLSYSLVNENGEEESTSNLLNVNDYLRFENSLYRIAEISQLDKRVRLDYSVGYETITVNNELEFYNQPFSDKIIEVGIGINEVNILYVKGINENYNLLSRSWSNPISFYTNELYFKNTNETFESYYNNNVADFGKTWIAQAKEKQVYAYNGLTPNAPVLNASDLSVVQINTQLDATLDKEKYNKLTSEIASVKSNIAATRTTITSNKDALITATNIGDRTNYQNLINTDTESLNYLTTQYNSLVEELNTLVNESNIIKYSPKYHIRGFFAIPESRYVDTVSKAGEQAVIGFEIMYRYLHTDETGVKLNTYEFSDANSIIQTGIFSDWNIAESCLLTKEYDETTMSYVWKNENTADGSIININQIDIPIRKGEKVEIKVRSISEAGYPYNPLKSDWSNSVIIGFPENLTSDDAVSTILSGVKDDMTAVVLQETLSAAGVYTHLSDTDSTYKHNAKNISISLVEDGNSNNVTTSSLQATIESLMSRIKKLENKVENSES